PVTYLAVAVFFRRPIGFRRFTLEAPTLRLAVGQIAVGTANFACVAGCLHQALAAVANTAYLQTAAVYVIANATALVSHVPGGLGVIESVVMVLHPGQDLIGPLLVFRFVYFLAPLMIGGPLLAGSEAVFRWRDRSASAQGA
ncbi:MAG TPA: UPF0104 family protein, partial [Methylomirabilota bacterium]|nr:UPF0104 family protein [Methylomirabilota bacterium]